MKKVLFLAIAALAYAGSVNAQVTLDATGATLPTPATATDVTDGATYQLTLGGTYDFVAGRTNWTTTLGTSYTSVINGSQIDLTRDLTNTSLADASNITTAVGSAGTATITVTGAATVSDLKVDEYTYDTYNAKSSCSTSITAKFGSKPVPTLQVTDDKSTQCVGAASAVTVNLTSITAGTAKRWLKVSLSYVDGNGANQSVINSKNFDITGQTSLSIPASLITAAGKYTLTAEQLWDEFSLEAKNASTLGTLATSNVDHFTALPKPVPTLKTNAIQ